MKYPDQLSSYFPSASGAEQCYRGDVQIPIHSRPVHGISALEAFQIALSASSKMCSRKPVACSSGECTVCCWSKVFEISWGPQSWAGKPGRQAGQASHGNGTRLSRTPTVTNQFQRSWSPPLCATATSRESVSALSTVWAKPEYSWVSPHLLLLSWWKRKSTWCYSSSVLLWRREGSTCCCCTTWPQQIQQAFLSYAEEYTG